MSVTRKEQDTVVIVHFSVNYDPIDNTSMTAFRPMKLKFWISVFKNISERKTWNLEDRRAAFVRNLEFCEPRCMNMVCYTKTEL